MSSPQDTYPLPRHPSETQRLNAQHHHLVNDVFAGHLIHPTILSSLQKTRGGNIRIADISCGTGIWLLETVQFLKQSNQVSGDGFDISSLQFPSTSEKKDTNVEFHVSDAADPQGAGKEFDGVFDIVNIRLMHVNLSTPSQWRQAVHNAIQMLKPAGEGWIQWQDWDCSAVQIFSLVPNARKSALEELASGYRDFLKKERCTDQTEKIGEYLVEEGCVDVRVERFLTGTSEHGRKFATGTMGRSWPHLLRGTLCKVEGSGWNEVRVGRLERDVEGELEAGEAWVKGEFMWYVGRRGWV